MAIIRWDPFRDITTFRERMNKLFEDTLSTREEKDLMATAWSPSVDIYETENEIVLSAELPGVNEDDVEIKIEDRTLSLRGERKLEKETKEENYHRIERSYGSFYRSFTLPNNVDMEKIKAEHDNGILKIMMPKKPELKPRKIKVLKATKKAK